VSLFKKASTGILLLFFFLTGGQNVFSQVIDAKGVYLLEICKVKKDIHAIIYAMGTGYAKGATGITHRDRFESNIKAKRDAYRKLAGFVRKNNVCLSQTEIRADGYMDGVAVISERYSEPERKSKVKLVLFTNIKRGFLKELRSSAVEIREISLKDYLRKRDKSDFIDHSEYNHWGLNRNSRR